ncbi:MAG: alpha/beta hydrolase [Erysipelotrichaceae bacterium]|nr:alpha/beta hydrolase [Erysipelotrichaceae bacterium]
MPRSRNAIICEKLAKRIILPKGKTMSEVMLRYKRARKKQKYNLPLLMKMSDNVEGIVSHDMKLFYMNVESASDTLVIYLHGGGYVDEMLVFHWLMLDKITSKAKSTFIIPEYPLAPYYDFKDCYEKMSEFYKKVLEYYRDKKIILMGDSAGGGLCVGLSMYFSKLGLRQPDKLILLSPWIDLVMDNPEINNYIKDDPMLKYNDLKVDAEFWANGTSLRDYRLSPIYGDVTCLKDVTIFVGTHEFFYPDIIKFAEKLKENGIRNKLYVGEGLNHVYPVFPIPEADEAIKKITRIIDGK